MAKRMEAWQDVWALHQIQADVTLQLFTECLQRARHTLKSGKPLPGLCLAGQINGTTDIIDAIRLLFIFAGYEEAGRE